MNVQRIVESLNWAVDQGVQPFSPIEPAASMSSAFTKNMYANNMVSAPQHVRQVVSETLKQEPELQIFDSGCMFMRSGGRATSLEVDRLSDWLLAQTLLHGSLAAVQRLQEFMEGWHRGVLEILALSGVTVEEEIRLTEGVALVPFSSLPESQTKEYFSSTGYESVFDPMRPIFMPQLGAALVRTDGSGVQLSAESLDDIANDIKQYSKMTLFSQICKCLTLFGPSSPVALVQWSQLQSPAEVPILGMGEGQGISIPEARPETTTTLSDSAAVRCLVERYLGLSEDMRERLAVPLQRLNLALRRQDPVDKAIELGIALEALLTKDEEQDSPVSYSVRTRGALLGGGTLDERKQIRNLLQDVYNLRSEAVHSGKFRKKNNKRKTKQDPDKILSRGSELCARLISRVIETGTMPDWDELILNPNMN